MRSGLELVLVLCLGLGLGLVLLLGLGLVLLLGLELGLVLLLGLGLGLVLCISHNYRFTFGEVYCHLVGVTPLGTKIYCMIKRRKRRIDGVEDEIQCCVEIQSRSLYPLN